MLSKSRYENTFITETKKFILSTSFVLNFVLISIDSTLLFLNVFSVFMIFDQVSKNITANDQNHSLLKKDNSQDQKFSLNLTVTSETSINNSASDLSINQENSKKKSFSLSRFVHNETKKNSPTQCAKIVISDNHTIKCHYVSVMYRCLFIKNS